MSISYFREKVVIDKVSEELFISKSTVSRIFSQKLKISFNDYVNLLRLNEFFNILEGERCTITAAALSAGFQTVRTFNNVFMKHYGISPSEYVKNKKIIIARGVTSGIFTIDIFVFL